MSTRWLDPHTGLVHVVAREAAPVRNDIGGSTFLVVPKDLQVTITYPKYMRCGHVVQVDDTGHVEHESTACTFPWVYSSAAPTCLDCVSFVAATGMGQMVNDWESP